MNSARWPQSARWRRPNADAESVDLMICSNVISDHVTPAPGCFIAGALGYTGQTLDINGACTGFLKALDAADSAIRAGKARRVLIIAARTALCPVRLDRPLVLHSVRRRRGRGAAGGFRRGRVPVHRAAHGVQRGVPERRNARQQQSLFRKEGRGTLASDERPGGLPLCGLLLRQRPERGRAEGGRRAGERGLVPAASGQPAHLKRRAATRLHAAEGEIPRATLRCCGNTSSACMPAAASTRCATGRQAPRTARPSPCPPSARG